MPFSCALLPEEAKTMVCKSPKYRQCSLRKDGRISTLSSRKQAIIDLKGPATKRDVVMTTRQKWQGNKGKKLKETPVGCIDKMKRIIEKEKGTEKIEGNRQLLGLEVR